MDKELLKLEDKKFLANKADRAGNTDKIIKKLDEIKPGEMTMKFDAEPNELAAALFSVLKGPKGDKGESGDKGDKPIAGEDYSIPENGKDYVLTETDKKEIAKKIKVPVVEKIIEKTQVIKEQPIVTNEIKEVAVTDTAEEIVEKLQNLKKAWLEVSMIKGLDLLLNDVGNNFLTQAKGFIPRTISSLYDTDIKNPVDGQAIVWNATKQKWIVGAVVSSSVGTGFTLLPATGTVDGDNTIFTFTQKPTYIVSDGVWMIENSGWSWSGFTATLTSPPQTGIWGFV